MVDPRIVAVLVTVSLVVFWFALAYRHDPEEAKAAAANFATGGMKLRSASRQNAAPGENLEDWHGK
mgnify:CR=1 FL=1